MLSGPLVKVASCSPFAYWTLAASGIDINVKIEGDEASIRQYINIEGGALKGGDYASLVKASDERIKGAAISADLFPMMRIEPVMGRLFSAEEDVEGRGGVALISYELWQQHFACSVSSCVERSTTSTANRPPCCGRSPAGT